METKFDNFILIDHPLIKRDVTILRNQTTGTEIFRAALHRISTILAAEVSRSFNVSETTVETPLERTAGYKLIQQVVLVPVLRAGLGMVSGFLEIIPDAKAGHIGLQRDEETLKPVEYYYKTPKNLDKSIVILLDPMLATGGSATEAIKYLKKRGALNIVFACLVAAPEGVMKMQAKTILDRK